MSRIAVALVALVATFLVPVGASAQGLLENPPNGAFESGIAAVTGWHCTSRDIELRVDGVSLGKAGTGTPRADTQGTCGRSDTGYSLLFNFALLHGGTHRIDAYADGQLFASSTFTAGYSGSEFLTGIAATHEVPDFPTAGSKARIAWSQPKQNFVLTDVTPMGSGAIAGRYVVRHFSGISSANAEFSTLQSGTSVSGTITFIANGTYSGTLTITANGASQNQGLTGTWSDQGAYLLLDGAPSPILERGETLAFQILANDANTWLASAVSLARTSSGSDDTFQGGIGLRDLALRLLPAAGPPPPAVAGCPTGANGTVMAAFPGTSGTHVSNDGSPSGYWLQPTGVITAMQLPSLPSGYASGSVQMTYGSHTPGGTTLYEISISRCPGIIDTTGASTGAGPYCYFGSSNPTSLSIVWFARNSSTYGALGTLPAKGYCVADETQGPWYANLRYTYSTCAYGPGNCGEQLQWNLNSN